MISRFPVLAMMAPALMIGGCADSWRGVESVHQPVVSQSQYALDLTTDGSALAPGEAARLSGWMAAMRVGYGDRIHVDDPGNVAFAAREEIAAVAARQGLLLSEAAPITAGPIADGAVRVIVSRMAAGVPGCPDHSDDFRPNWDQHTSANFGCAINANLAAMVARPEDLVRGQTGAGFSDPNTAVKAIDSFRKAPPTGEGGLKKETTSQGGN